MMHHRFVALLVVALLLPSLAVAPARAAGQPAYTITEIPLMSVIDLNNAGQVVGSVDANPFLDPAIWEAGKPLRHLPALASGPQPVRGFFVEAINDAGMVVGQQFGGPMLDNPAYTPVVWEDDAPRALPGVDDFRLKPVDINSGGRILGVGIAMSPYRQTLVSWENGVPTRIDQPAVPGNAQLSDSGQILTSIWSGGSDDYPAVWQNGQVKMLLPPVPNPERYCCYATAINDTNMAVGNITGEKVGQGKFGGTVLWRDFIPTILPTLAAAGGRATHLNDRGQVVGYGHICCDVDPRNDVAITWLGGRALDLNTLIPTDSGWRLGRAEKINDRGQILGTGFKGGAAANFLLTPTGAPLFDFGDVPASDPAFAAIGALAGLSIINGCDAAATPPQFCPGDTTLRSQMAALIVRAMPGWLAENWPNTFTDKGVVDDELWRRVATLQHHGVVTGYPDCPAQGQVTPCYGPTDPVNRAQAISFVTRAMVKKGYWTDRPIDPALHQGGLAGTGHEQDAATYWHYTRAKGGVPDYREADPFPTFEAAPRGWFARLLWTAIQGTPAAP